MTDKMQRFCDLYLSNGRNATQAYKDAGYKWADENTAGSSASKMLRNPKIQEYLGNHAETLKAKAEHDSKLLTVEDLCAFWAGVTSGSITETLYDGRKKSMVEAPAKISDRLKASELYGKFLGAFTTNVNMQGTAAIVIKDDVKE